LRLPESVSFNEVKILLHQQSGTDFREG